MLRYKSPVIPFLLLASGCGTDLAANDTAPADGSTEVDFHSIDKSAEAISDATAFSGIPAVGKLYFDNGPYNVTRTCTATLIAPTQIMVAVQCMAYRDEPYAHNHDGILGPLSDWSFITSNGDSVSLQVPFHYLTSQGFYGVAVVDLARQPTGVTPLPFATPVDMRYLNKGALAIGYGVYDSNSPPARTGTYVDITWLSPWRLFSETLPGQNYTPTYEMGDSGVPLIWRDRVGNYSLLGVSSERFNPYADTTSHERLDVISDLGLSGIKPVGQVEGHSFFSYSKSNTASASTNTANATVYLEKGDTIEFGTCSLPHTWGSGDTYIRILDSGGATVGGNDDAPSGTPTCKSYDSYGRYTAWRNDTYTIKGGCYSSNSCVASLAYQVWRAGFWSGDYGLRDDIEYGSYQYVDVPLLLGANDIVEFGTCGLPASGDSENTHLQLLKDGVEISATDLTPSTPSCSSVTESYLRYQVPAGGTGVYTLRYGCIPAWCYGLGHYRVIPANPELDIYSLTGGSSGGTNNPIVLTGSDPGVGYFLYADGSLNSIVGYMVGTGGPLNFGVHTTTATSTTYSVLATRFDESDPLGVTGPLRANMANSVTVNGSGGGNGYSCSYSNNTCASGYMCCDPSAHNYCSSSSSMCLCFTSSYCYGY